jgi:hypothetical protein
MSLHLDFEQILARYISARQEEAFGTQHPLWASFSSIQQQLMAHVSSRFPGFIIKASMGMGNWAKVPWIAVMDPEETRSTQSGIYCVYLFREDLTGVYLTLNQGVTQPKRIHGTREGRRVLKKLAAEARDHCQELEVYGFSLDEGINLRASGGLGIDYEYSTIAYKFYARGSIPQDPDLLSDLDAVLSAYRVVLHADLDRSFATASQAIALEHPAEHASDALAVSAEMSPARSNFDLQAGMERLLNDIASTGFVFEPWQIAHFITAVRTKPFVILAGISGTGKSKLPVLVAKATGSAAEMLPVRPDWTDSSEILGYTDLKGEFRPGPALEFASSAKDDDRYWFCVLDEMNLARVELYFAEVLSSIESRRPAQEGGFETPRLVTQVSAADAEWGNVGIPPNFAIVGTVNMDESTQAFSRKVLDRAFVLELSDVNLADWKEQLRTCRPISTLVGETWPIHAWYPRAIAISGLSDLSESETAEVQRSVDALVQINEFLAPAQIQLGYRSRDEVALFLLHAREIQATFVTRNGDAVDPLDLALLSKVLPRIVGGHGAIRRALWGILVWTAGETAEANEATARVIVADWEQQGRPAALEGSRFPRTAARLCMMWDRLEVEGFTSFWL